MLWFVDYDGGRNRMAVVAVLYFCVLIASRAATLVDCRGGTNIPRGWWRRRRRRCWMKSRRCRNDILFRDIVASCHRLQQFGGTQRYGCTLAENYQICGCERVPALVFLLLLDLFIDQTQAWERRCLRLFAA